VKIDSVTTMLYTGV